MIDLYIFVCEPSTLHFHQLPSSMRNLLFAIGLFPFITLNGQVLFENVSTSSGLTYQGRSWGSSWGDINGDGFMDLFMSCHQHRYEPYFTNDSIRLLLNTGDGHFDGTVYTLEDGGQSDIHGGVFYDQDNDGDQDLYIVTGGKRYEIFLRNDGSPHLSDVTEDLNLILFNARGRQSTCVDFNNDGRTDLLMNNQRVETPPGYGSLVLLAHPDSGYVIDTNSGFNDEESRISIISDLDGDNRTDICVVTEEYLKIYSLTPAGQFIEQTQLDISNITDISIADVNGDLLPDLFVARGSMHETDVQLFNDSAIHASYNVGTILPPCKTTFKTQGPIEIVMSTEDYKPYNIHIGQNTNVDNATYRQTFTLHPGPSTGFQSPLSFPPGVHCSIGRQPNNKWKVQVAKTDVGVNSILMEIKSGSPITDLTSTGIAPMDSTVRDLLLLNQGNFQFTPSTSPAFLLDEYSANVTSGDLDNDMDIDLFVVSTGRAKNRKTRLYENLGNGDFTVHENGWGTKGDVAGIGDAVTTTDYDNDGFLDLFVTNGSTNVFLDSAGIDLYRNLGNGNHWIKLDLTGVQSNPDGFGARVIVQANGIQQVRDMTGGIHLVSQDDARLHFGLGSASTAELITVYWPSGTVDVRHEVAADQILTLVEGEHDQAACPGGDETLLLTLRLDPHGSQTTWKLLNADNTVAVTGGPYTDGESMATDTLCVPVGCYKLKVFDANGDGISGGGYTLTNAIGQHIIDADGAFGAVSTVGSKFCIPIGPVAFLEGSCDLIELNATDSLVTTPIVGASAYQFWVFNPHGGYSQRHLGSVPVLGPGLGAVLPHDLPLDIRARALVSGAWTEFGPACTLLVPSGGGMDQGAVVRHLAAAAGQADLQLWPNPIDAGHVNLSIVGLEADASTVALTVFDALGQRALVRVLPVTDGSLTATLDLGTLAEGMYILKAATANVSFTRHMAVKQ